MQLKPTMEPRSDYQSFDLINGKVSNIGQRMAKKLEMVHLPDLTGKRVLDVGCDFGFWSYLSINRGASYTLGLDRNRVVKGVGYTDIVTHNTQQAHKNGLNCEFKQMDLGKSWFEHGKFDVIYLFSLYHHIYENVGEHLPIWYWLYRHCEKDAVLIWENPTDLSDGVSHEHISGDKREGYTKDKILSAASEYFEIEYKGQGHVDTRSVYFFRPKQREEKEIDVHLIDGAGGASPAFLHQSGRRMREIAAVLGYIPHPGSLNLLTSEAFKWSKDYYRAQILDVKVRGKGLDVEWHKRWARFYPVRIDGHEAHAFKFEGDKYPDHFVELIAPQKLRKVLGLKAVLSD